LYDTVGTGDREWSQRLGRASYAVLFHWLDVELAARRSLIAESTFDPRAEAAFAALPAHVAVQVFCTAPAEVLLRRYGERRRHPGHVDADVLEELRDGQHEARFRPLELGGDLVVLDTTSFDGLDLAPVTRLVAAELGPPGGARRV
jgi:hypothetical protein